MLDAGFQLQGAQIHLLRQTGQLESWIQSDALAQPSFSGLSAKSFGRRDSCALSPFGLAQSSPRIATKRVILIGTRTLASKQQSLHQNRDALRRNLAPDMLNCAHKEALPLGDLRLRCRPRQGLHNQSQGRRFGVFVEYILRKLRFHRDRRQHGLDHRQRRLRT